MAWQQSGYPYPQQQGPPPAGFAPGGFNASGAPPYPGGQPYPGTQPYPGAQPYPGQQFPGAAPYPGPDPYSGTQSMPYNNYGTGEAGGAATAFAFSDKTIRMAFIRKVYSILMIQLAITAFFISLFVMDVNTQKYVAKNPGLFWVAFGVTIVCMIAMACCESVRRQTPTNYIFLFLFTLAEGFLLGVLSAQYQAKEVLLAVAITAIVCFGLTVFAFQTKVDFTAMGGILFVAVLILFIFGIVLMFFHDLKPLRVMYACAGAFIFSIYLIYDTQLMIGGNHKYSISPEEYVFASLNLYLDIINIFIYILSIIGESRD